MKVGLSNLQISSDGVNYTPLCSTTEVTFECEKQDINYEWLKDINKPAEMSFTLKAKKRGNEIEKCLYYQKSKKKRIRKKWNFERRILGRLDKEKE